MIDNCSLDTGANPVGRSFLRKLIPQLAS
jgi:hypothetical protein